jgi:hypothetical protein
MSPDKCIIILSERSSGSSALQNYLVKFAGARHATTHRHFENETLFWTKAASVLGLPQIKMVDSRVPFSSGEAKKDLLVLLAENVPDFQPPADDYDWIMQSWRQLCRRFTPLFIEKSPHHLCEWSALDLILQAQRALEDVDFLIIGLVRNPLDTIYSHFERWKSIPALVEKQWVVSYQNLLRFREQLPEKTIIIRYEDLIKQPKVIEPILQFCGFSPSKEAQTYLPSRSVHKWKTDRWFSFGLSQESQQLAMHYGYQDEELQSQGNFWAPAYHRLMHIGYHLARKVRPLRVDQNPTSHLF